MIAGHRRSSARDCQEGWADVGDGKAGGRKRAVGTRDRVMAHLLMAGEVTDPSGLASTVLAEAVGYPGSSVAFAQLLCGMERSGLIKREVRGKRTYRISGERRTGPGTVGAGAAARRQGRRRGGRRGWHRGRRLRRAGAAAPAAGRAAAWSGAEPGGGRRARPSSRWRQAGAGPDGGQSGAQAGQRQVQAAAADRGERQAA
jgi:hypothetical protein